MPAMMKPMIHFKPFRQFFAIAAITITRIINPTTPTMIALLSNNPAIIFPSFKGGDKGTILLYLRLIHR